VEARLERDPQLPQYDILIQPLPQLKEVKTFQEIA